MEVMMFPLNLYSAKAFCHCGTTEPMVPTGNSIYKCRGCGYGVRFFFEEAKPEWYTGEVMRSPEFPVCLECGKTMTGSGVTVLEEQRRYFQIVGLACKPNEKHPKRKVGAYGMEISRKEYMVDAQGAQETLIQWALEGRILSAAIPEAPTIAEGIRVIMDITLRLHDLANMNPDGTRTVNTSGFSESERKLCLEACQLYTKHGLLHDLTIEERKLSFRVDEKLTAALDAATNEKASA
jgi:hypothetical protein